MPFILIVVSPARAETPVFLVIPGGVSDHLISAEHVLTHWYGPDVPRNIWYAAPAAWRQKREPPSGLAPPPHRVSEKTIRVVVFHRRPGRGAGRATAGPPSIFLGIAGIELLSAASGALWKP